MNKVLSIIGGFILFIIVGIAVGYVGETITTTIELQSVGSN